VIPSIMRSSYIKARKLCVFCIILISSDLHLSFLLPTSTVGILAAILPLIDLYRGFNAYGW
jgi:hypothetical protein